MCEFIPLHSCDYLYDILLKANVLTGEDNDGIKTRTLNKEMKFFWFYKVGSECKLNSWPDSSIQ